MNEVPGRDRRRWRGRGRRGDEDRTETLSSALDAYLSSQGLDHPRDLAEVLARWTATVGDEVANHATPTALRGGELVVSVDHPSWATELSFLSAGILDRLADQLGRRVVERVKVTVRPNRRLD